MADVHEVRTARRGRVWPAVVMLVLVLLLVGIIVAMVMNVRGSISWPAGGIEFGFRPHLYVTRTEGVIASPQPITLATNVVPAIAPADPAADVEPVQPAPTAVLDDADSAVPAEIRQQPVE